MGHIHFFSYNWNLSKIYEIKLNVNYEIKANHWHIKKTFLLLLECEMSTTTSSAIALGRYLREHFTMVQMKRWPHPASTFQVGRVLSSNLIWSLWSQDKRFTKYKISLWMNSAHSSYLSIYLCSIHLRIVYTASVSFLANVFPPKNDGMLENS